MLIFCSGEMGTETERNKRYKYVIIGSTCCSKYWKPRLQLLCTSTFTTVYLDSLVGVDLSLFSGMTEDGCFYFCRLVCVCVCMCQKTSES